MKYISDKVLKVADIAEYFDEVIEAITLQDEQLNKTVRYIFKDGSSIDIEYSKNIDRIIDRTLGNSIIRQPY